ncbi:MAG: hypothetical protein CSB13_01705 [Chloroflexi bacterium]|nr:MAG: hypothetical protein CSB13_01705 [Chloroflexota bacterium]
MGLIYMNARYYAPTLNRFLSADTIVPDPTNPQQYNRYSYTLNNPINLIDPSGHCTENYAGEDQVDLLNQCIEGWNAIDQYYADMVWGKGANRDREYPRDWINYLLVHADIAMIEAIMGAHGIDYGYTQTGIAPRPPRTSSGRSGQMAREAAYRSRCWQYQDCYEPVVTAEEMKPDAAVVGGSVSGGVLQGGVTGQEVVINGKSGEIDVFGYAGGGTVVGAKVAGTGYTGLLWNLEDNMDYVGPSSALTVDVAFIEGAQVNFVWETGTIPFTGETWGVTVGWTAAGAGASISATQSYYWHEFKIQ